VIIAIDGPVAAGKSAVGKRLADKLGYMFFDTGLLYRAITYLALRAYGSVEDEAAVSALAGRAHLDVRPPTVPDGRDCTVLSEGEDITLELRRPEVENNVSPVSAIPEVRQVLTAHMRRAGLRGRVVMVGRDVGTVILPEADLKIFLTASVETRARRRFAEMEARGEARTHGDILANLRERDRIDATRTTAPLLPATDAIRLDTTEMELDEVVTKIENLIRRDNGR
jgi:cytidylate kinase